METAAVCVCILLASLLELLLATSSSSQCQMMVDIPECWCTVTDGGLTHYDCLAKSLYASLGRLSQQAPDASSIRVVCADSKENFLTEDKLKRFTDLKVLSIQQCTLAPMDANTFHGARSLMFLSLEHCSLTNSPLHPNLLSPLTNLQHLVVSACKLRSFPSLYNLTALTHLNVSKNQLTSLTADVEGIDVYDHDNKNSNLLFREKSFENLTLLDMTYNAIHTFPYDIIKGAVKLVDIHFHNNNITSFQVPACSALPSLTTIDGKENPLEEIVFDWNASEIHACLKVLRFDGTGMGTVDDEKLYSLQSLTELRLRNFNITNTIWQFLNSVTLVKLDLSQNQLGAIDISLLPSLLILLIGHNGITHFSETMFSQQPNLLAVNASHNSLTSLPGQTFQANNHMQALDLSHNLLSSLDNSSLHGLTSLVYLSLGHNDLPFLPANGLFRDLGSLGWLDLQANRLESLPSLASLGSLSRLDVSHNFLLTIQTTGLTGLGQLEILDLSYNNLTTISAGELDYCPRLLEANYAYNTIHTVGSFHAHPRLSTLRLDGNNISDSVQTSPFARLPRLKYLFLDENQFEFILPEMFPPSLEYLSMSQNRIQNVLKNAFKNLHNLKQVNLMFNDAVMLIGQIAVAFFGDLEPKPVFNMAFNTFTCNCHMSYLKAWDIGRYKQPALYYNYPNFHGLDQAYCLTIPDLPNTASVVPFKELPLSDFACTYSEAQCDFFCDCCLAGSLVANDTYRQCPCVLTCPTQCLCLQGGSAFLGVDIIIRCDSRELASVPDLIPARAHVVHLDGNNIPQLGLSDLSHLRSTRHLYLNGSHLEHVQDGAFDNITELQALYLHNNSLKAIGAAMFGQVDSLSRLYLHHNLITTIAPGWLTRLPALTFVSLHHNRLTRLPTQMPRLDNGVALTLAGNPWSCNCRDITSLSLYVRSMSDAVYDGNRICCYDDLDMALFVSSQESDDIQDLNMKGDKNCTALLRSQNVTSGKKTNSGHCGSNSDISDPHTRTTNSELQLQCLLVINFNHTEHCDAQSIISNRGTEAADSNVSSSAIQPAFMVMIVVLSAVMVAFFLVLLVVWQRKGLQAWCYVKAGVRLFDQIAEEEKGEEQKAFDAFLSYNNKDVDYVVNTLVPMLEGRHKYRVCVHYRDFPVGGNITDSICSAIDHSSRTILLLSRDFLQSEWCRYEFQTAHLQVLTQSSHRLILVLLEDIPEDLVDPDLKMLLTTRTYLKVNDRWFWEKLCFAMPDIRGRKEDQDVLRGMKILNDEQESRFPATRSTQQDNQAYISDHDLENSAQNIDGSFEQLYVDKELHIDDCHVRIGDFLRGTDIKFYKNDVRPEAITTAEDNNMNEDTHDNLQINLVLENDAMEQKDGISGRITLC